MKAAAIEDAGLLTRVVAFRERFYRIPWSHLDQARPGTLRLVPPDFRLKELAADHKAMQGMLIGERPTLEEIIEYLAVLENEVNSA